MPIPESSVLSPEIEIIDPEWSNCLPAQKYLIAMVKFQDGESSVEELDSWGAEMVDWWRNLDALDARKRK